MKNNNNKLPFLNTRKAIKKWLDKHKIKNSTINDDLSVDVNGDVNISRKNLKTIPIKFRKVTGSFYCYDNELTSLIGSPESVGDHFYCVGNKLILLTELINCDFKGELCFNIDEKNFTPKKLIQTLKKYYNSEYTCYILNNNEFLDIIKPQIQKELLQQKLNTSKTKTKTKANFI